MRPYYYLLNNLMNNLALWIIDSRFHQWMLWKTPAMMNKNQKIRGRAYNAWEQLLIGYGLRVKGLKYGLLQGVYKIMVMMGWN